MRSATSPKIGTGLLGLALWLGCSEQPSAGEAPTAQVRLGVTTLSSEFPVAHPSYEGEWPASAAVAAGPPGYLSVVLARSEPYKLPVESYFEAVVTRIAPDGTLVDPLGTNLGPAKAANVVRVAGHWLILLGTSSGVTCSTMADDGTVTPSGIVLGGSSPGVLRVAYGGATTLVLQGNGNGFLLADDCMPASGALSLAPSSSFTNLSVAFDGTSYWLGYVAYALGSKDRYVLQRVSTAGAPVGSPIDVYTASWTRDVSDTEGYEGVEGMVAAEPGAALVAYSPITWNGQTRVATWETPRHRSLASDGTLGTELTLSGVPGAPVRASPAGDGFVLVSAYPTVLVKVAQDGSEVGRLTSSQGLPDGAALAVNRGTDLLFNGGTSFWRYAGDLTRLQEPSPFVLHANDQARPAVATAGDVRLVVWDDDWGAQASRLSTSGTIIDSEPTVLVPRAGSPWGLVAAASNGSDFLVAVRSQVNTSSGLYASRISATGAMGFQPTLLASDVGWQKPVVASDGTDFLVAWAYSTVNTDQVFAARFSASGALIDSTPIPVIGLQGLGSLALAYDGTDYVLAYGNAWDNSIHVGRISRAGAVLGFATAPWQGSLQSLGWGQDSGLLTYQMNSQGNPLYVAVVPKKGDAFDSSSVTVTTTGAFGEAPVAWDGNAFWVAWRDTRRGFLGPDLLGDAYANDAYASRISPAGSILDPAGVLLSQNERSSSPEVALSGEPGQVFATYARWDPSHEYRAARLRGRVLSDDDNAGAGGAGGSGGAGTSGNGGAGASAGTSGNGGTGATAGASENGGTGGRGGATSSGGTAGRGGAISSGGQAGRGGTPSAQAGEGGDAGGNEEVGGESTGGAANVGGRGGTGAKPGGGSHAGGEAGDGGTGTPPPSTLGNDDSGCGCRAAGVPSGSSRAFALLGLVLAIARRVRRRS